MPWDKWFGSFHDGTVDAHKWIFGRQMEGWKVSTCVADTVVSQGYSQFNSKGQFD